MKNFENHYYAIENHISMLMFYLLFKREKYKMSSNEITPILNLVPLKGKGRKSKYKYLNRFQFQKHIVYSCVFKVLSFISERVIIFW